MRGKVVVSIRGTGEGGITPAYAGKSGRDTCSAEPHKDHPRLCGEKSPESPFSQVQTGSPPPMRGKEIICWNWSRWSGITPAYAGKSSSHTRRCPSIEDHPRLCGEKHMEVYAICDIIWITPAYAGKSHGTE